MLASLCAVVLPLAVLAPPAMADEEPTTFTVALLNEVDSFNPFLGIEAESFEMWALAYDYLVGYSMEDMSPEPALATEWETSDDGLTWTFTMRDDVTWSDGEPLTAQDVAYTYGRILDGGPEAATWSSYLTGVESVEAPDDTTVVLTLKKPNAVLPLLPIPIVPEHVWKDVPRGRGQELRQRAQGRAAGGRLGPVPAGRGHRRRLDVPLRGQPGLLEGRAARRPGGLPGLQERRPGRAGADQGRGRLRRGPVRAAGPVAARASEGITAHNGDSPSFDEIAFNTGSVDLETGDPIGDPNPAVLDPAFRYALNFALDREQLIRTVYQGGGKPGGTIIPPAYGDYVWTPPEADAFAFDLDKAGQLLDEAGYTVGDDGKRTLPDGDPIGTIRLAARSDSQTSVDVMDYFKEWLGDLGIDAEVQAYESSKLTDVILDGEFDAFEWGWYVEPDPDSMLSYMTCGQRGSWSDSWYCNEEYDALYQQQHVEIDDAARAGPGQADAGASSTATRRTSSRRTPPSARRSAATGSPASSRSPTRAASGWSSTARTTTSTCARPRTPVTATASTTAVGAGGAEAAADSGSSDDGMSTGVLIGLGVAAGVVVVLGAVVWMRRRTTADDRE